jgi:hypothetical protein
MRGNDGTGIRLMPRIVQFAKEFLIDNLGAARGRLPDAARRKRMEQFIDNV